MKIKSKYNVGNKTTSPLPWEDALKLIEFLKKENPILCVGVFLTLRTGLRCADIVRLKWMNISSQKLNSIDGKSSKHNGMRIKDDCWEYIQGEYNSKLGCLNGILNKDYVMSVPSEYKYGNRHRYGMYDTEKKIKGKLNRDLRAVLVKLFPEWAKNQKGIGWHSLRKTFGLHFYSSITQKQANGDIPIHFSAVDVVGAALNHSDSKTTFRYIGVLDDTLDTAIDLMD